MSFTNGEDASIPDVEPPTEIDRMSDRNDLASSSSMGLLTEEGRSTAMALGLAALVAAQPEAAVAKGGEYGIFEGRIASLAHPTVMSLMYGVSAYSAFTGFQWRRLRELGTEMNDIKKQRKALEARIPPPPVSEGDEEVSTSQEDPKVVALKQEVAMLDAKIDELKAERKELSSANLRDKHYQMGSVLLGLGTAFAIEGPVNTFLRAQKLFPGPHLYAGAGVVVCWAMAASLAPRMQKGEEWAREAHIAFNVLALSLFTWQLPTGWEITQKVIKNTNFP
jgi:hypothetical protein